MLRPAVLVFDDSTAAIDAGTEQRIRSGDEALRQGPRDADHLAPAELADACRPDPVRRGRPHRRARHASRNCWRSGGRYRALYDLQVRPDDDRPVDGGSRMMSTQPTTTTTKEDTQRPAAEGRRRLAPRRRGGLRQGLRSAHRPPHLELREALPRQDLHLGRRGAGVHADAARDPADHPLRHRQRHGGGQADRVGAGLGDRRLRGRRSSINYGASYVQESVVGKVAENVLFDMRRAMFAHLQRVSLSFMDKTEVGRLMSRLQGDVNSMQEFLETSVMSVGDIVLLFGIVSVLLWLDFRLGLLTLSTMPIAVHRAPVLAAARQGRLHGRARDQLDRQRRAGRGHPRRAHGAEPRAPARQFRPLRREGAGQSQDAPDRRRNTRR